MDDEASIQRAFEEAVGRLGRALLVGVDGLEKAFRRLHPPAFASQEAALVYREIEDLSHTYPREENARIIEWFDPRRAVRG